MAASLGQMILIENVWNHMFYDHDAPPEQTADQFVKFIDSFNSPWVGMYYDIGNHWKYGQPGEWIRDFGRRCVKLDVKGFSRAKNDWTEITEGDLPWDQVRKALDEIGFAGWATAEVGGGDVKRLTTVREQMERRSGCRAGCSSGTPQLRRWARWLACPSVTPGRECHSRSSRPRRTIPLPGRPLAAMARGLVNTDCLLESWIRPPQALH